MQIKIREEPHLERGRTKNFGNLKVRYCSESRAYGLESERNSANRERAPQTDLHPLVTHQKRRILEGNTGHDTALGRRTYPYSRLVSMHLRKENH